MSRIVDCNAVPINPLRPHPRVRTLALAGLASLSPSDLEFLREVQMAKDDPCYLLASEVLHLEPPLAAALREVVAEIAREKAAPSRIPWVEFAPREALLKIIARCIMRVIRLTPGVG